MFLMRIAIVVGVGCERGEGNVKGGGLRGFWSAWFEGNGSGIGRVHQVQRGGVKAVDGAWAGRCER